MAAGVMAAGGMPGRACRRRLGNHGYFHGRGFGGFGGFGGFYGGFGGYWPGYYGG